jgi:RNase adapter protein RapZ
MIEHRLPSISVPLNFVLFSSKGAGAATATQAFKTYGYQIKPIKTLPQGVALLQKLSGMGKDDKPFLLQCQIENAQELTTFTELLAPILAQKQLHGLYLDAFDEDLQARRLTGSAPTDLNAIHQERQHLTPCKTLCEYAINTSQLLPEELQLKVAKLLGKACEAPFLNITLITFGFKHGIPPAVDMVFDMRFLPNPFYEPALRPMSGLEAPVQCHIFKTNHVQAFWEHWTAMLTLAFEGYLREGKMQTSIGIGCTGGQHRSVAMAVRLAEAFSQQDPKYRIRVIHQNITHWPLSAQETAQRLQLGDSSSPCHGVSNQQESCQHV